LRILREAAKELLLRAKALPFPIQVAAARSYRLWGGLVVMPKVVDGPHPYLDQERPYGGRLLSMRHVAIRFAEISSRLPILVSQSPLRVARADFGI
jgi:hypothetical protein